MLLGCGAKVARNGTGNTPPVVNDIFVPAYVIVELTAEGHDADGDKLNYVWEVEKGELDSKTKRTVKWRLPSDVKSATVKVNANDGVHNSNSVSRKITVNLKNVDPVIKRLIVPESVIAGGSIQLGAEAIDPDGDSLSFNWSVDTGELSSETAQIPTWTAPLEAGSIRVKLKANDGINEPTLEWTTIEVISHPLIVAGEQAAGIKLGDSFNKVSALYGEPDRRVGRSGYFEYYGIGLSGNIDRNKLVKFLFIGKPNESQTVGRVRAGSHRKHVEEEFGLAEEIIELPHSEDDVRAAYWTKGISFGYDGDSLVTSVNIFKPRRLR